MCACVGGGVCVECGVWKGEVKESTKKVRIQSYQTFCRASQEVKTYKVKH